ncbi:hypothetical protein KCP73_00405 [Salmonella enterica subsp. enterica]|nr:hypothetical protein KCP73_00405 [Salmonella enterica subsp. enterica]
MPLWFARFKAVIAFTAVLSAAKIVRHYTAPVNLHRIMSGRKATPATEVTATTHCGSLGAIQMKSK